LSALRGAKGSSSVGRFRLKKINLQGQRETKKANGRHYDPAKNTLTLNRVATILPWQTSSTTAEAVAEAAAETETPVVTVEEEDGSDIYGGNVDNFPTILPVFMEEPEGSDSDSGNIDNFPVVPPSFDPTPRYKKHRNPPSPPIEIMSDDVKEEDDESSDDTAWEASSSSSNGGDSSVEQD